MSPYVAMGVDKELDFGQMKLIAIGESLAEQEADQMLDWLFDAG